MNTPAQDIDWIMQSQKVSDQELARILSTEFGLLLQHSARFLAGENEAGQLVQAAIHWTVGRRHQYWGESGLRAYVVRGLVCAFVERRISWWKKITRMLAPRAAGGPDLLLFLPGMVWSSNQSYAWAAGQPLAVTWMLLLRYWAGFHLQEIAFVFGSEAETIRLLVRAARREVAAHHQIHLVDEDSFPHKLMMSRIDSAADGNLDPLVSADIADHLRTCRPCQEYSQSLVRVDDLLSKFAAASWPTAMREQPVVEASEADAALLDSTGGRTVLPAWLREASLIVLLLAVVSLILLGGRALESTGGDLPAAAGMRWENITQVIPDLVTPAGLPPLDANSSVPAIIARQWNGRQTWSSLWAEVLAMDYGPLGYAGQPRIYANRVWLENGRRRLVMGGSFFKVDFYLLDSPLLYSEARLDENTWTILYGDPRYDPVETLEVSAPGPIGAADWSGHPAEQDRSRMLFYPHNAFTSWTDLKNLGDGGMVAGRATILIQGKDAENRLVQAWVDTAAGWVLRQQVFHPQDQEWAVSEVVVQKLITGIDFSEGTFDPFEPALAAWDAAPLPAGVTPGFDPLLLGDLLAGTGRDFKFDGERSNPPLSGFEAGDARLTFKFSQLPNSENERTWFAYLYGDNWYLGQIKAGNPWDMTCERSPSGKLLVFLNEIQDDPSLVREMRIVGLDNPSNSYIPLVNATYGSDVAFSPDGTLLAFSARDDGDYIGVYTLNLETHELWRLMETSWVARLAWSEDGSRVIVVGSGNSASNLAEIQIDEQTGLIRSGCPDCGNMMVWVVSVAAGGIDIAADFHNGDYGIFFPSGQPGLEGCVFP